MKEGREMEDRMDLLHWQTANSLLLLLSNMAYTFLPTIAANDLKKVIPICSTQKFVFQQKSNFVWTLQNFIFLLQSTVACGSNFQTI